MVLLVLIHTADLQIKKKKDYLNKLDTAAFKAAFDIPKLTRL